MVTIPHDRLTAPEYVALEEQYGAHTYKPLDIVLSRGEGAWVWDVDGKKYLDCLSAYSAVNQGHCHPRLVQALVDQAHTLTLTSRAFRNNQLGLFYETLCDLSSYEMVLPMNSGAEGVESAIKIARKWGTVVRGIPPNQGEIIVCEGNFHGRTTTVISASTEPGYRGLFGPFTPGFVSVPFGDAQALRQAITDRTAAFLIEPIQGEAGVRVPPPGYLAEVANICSAANILLIADEIQVGLGRTGRMFCFEHDGIRPDVLILGKALSGGMYPVSAVLSDRDVLGLFEPGEHGSTFGGNPLAARIGREALQILVDERLPERAAELGTHLMAGLRQIRSPYVRDIRGRGLLVGIELYPEAGGARRFCEALAGSGILCKETHIHVIRMAPPLVVARQDLDWAIRQIEQVLTAL